ncbi:MAG: hypothetical protein BRD49_03120 [Bacteroidetes bacterium SW_10_40_5]|nr:MAG: hypothetical protein BRD49_03120 [Bacteroidetes bacterium SW_10_40_5]
MPSIDEPKFINSSKAGYLSNDDRFLGKKINGIAKAYPIKILDHHELVNDQFKSQPTVITYCPLCGSGITFESTYNAQTLVVGVSGLFSTVMSCCTTVKLNQ